MNLKLDANSFLYQINKTKQAFFGHACRNNKCNLVDMHSRNDAGEKKKRAPQNAIHR